MSNWPATAAFVVLAACGFITTGCTGCGFGSAGYACTTSDQCGAGGTCETNFGGYCSFADTNCDSGRRFGDLAGDKSGQCVGGQPSGGIDASIDAPPDAQACFGTAPFTICLATAPTQPYMTSGATVIDTANPAMCATNVISGGANYCVIAATTIKIQDPLTASGGKPLVLLASETIVTTATIDVGSHRTQPERIGAGANPSTCDAGTPADNGGGGGGGSFTGKGGNGGDSALGGSKAGAAGAAVNEVTTVRGGCAGQVGDVGNGANPGLKGNGGGAIFLIAGTSIMVGGTINAAGEGGGGGMDNTSGGGGGGAGGMIGLDAPTVAVTSLLLANGGGGGEGSDNNNAGDPGEEPSMVGAARGGNGLVRGGNGGDGSAGAAAGAGGVGRDGDMFAGNRGGGGGGGGGAGIIKAPATATFTRAISPAVVH